MLFFGDFSSRIEKLLGKLKNYFNKVGTILIKFVTGKYVQMYYVTIGSQAKYELNSGGHDYTHNTNIQSYAI